MAKSPTQPTARFILSSPSREKVLIVVSDWSTELCTYAKQQNLVKSDDQ